VQYPSPPAKPPLFRPEALAAQSSQFLGTIRVATPPRLVAVAVVALTLVAGLLAFATLGQATRKAQVAGVLLPPGGLLQVSSPQPARLQSLQVTEGQTVTSGQVLAVLQLGGQSDKGDTATLLGQSLQARMDALQAEGRSTQAQAQQREQALGDRLRSLQRDITQAQGELEATQQRVRMAQSNLTRDQGLSQQGFLSAAQMQTRQEELLDMQVRERSAQRNLEALGREAQSVQAEVQTIRLQAQGQQAQIARTQATLAQEGTELDARNVLHLVAPGPATVGTLAAHPGQSLQAGQTVLSLLPSAQADATSPALQAQLYAPSRTAGFVEPGQAVWLRLHAFPYQKFGMVPGSVAEVSRTPVLPQDLPNGMASALMSAAQSQEPLYRITVALQHHSLQAFGKTQPLKAGMSLEADVIQDRRAIWEWVLEPLLAAKARWKIPSNDPMTTSPGGD
jgi:membrane fusion protein